MATAVGDDWTPSGAQAQILQQIKARADALRQSGAPQDSNDPVIEQLVAQLVASNGGTLSPEMMPKIGQALTGNPDYMNRTGLGDVLSTASTVAGVGAGALLGGEALGVFGGGGASSAAGGAGAADAGGAGAGAATADGGAAGSSIWSTIAKGAVPAAADIAGAYISANATNNAMAAQSQAAQNALDWAKSVYAQRRTDLSNQIGLGSGASARLSQLYGFPVSAPASTASSAAPLATLGSPQAAPAPSSQPSPTGGMVTLRAPDGSTKQLSQQDAQAYMQHYPQAGLQIVSA